MDKQIDNYYEKQQQKFKDIPNDIIVNFDDQKVEISKKNNTLLLKGNYIVIGTYNTVNNIWYWGWAIGFIDRNLVQETEKIIKWGKELMTKNGLHSKIDQIIYFYTKSGYFKIDYEQIILLVKIALFALKGIWIFEINKSECKEYILINKIYE
jgi:hypothetical protein